MPLHNTKGNARGPSNRIKRELFGLGPIEAFKNAKSRLFKVVTKTFYNSHIVLVHGPDFSEKLGNAKRSINNSSCLILTRADVARLVAMVRARRAAGVKIGNSKTSSCTYDSGQRFDIMCWGGSGKGERVNATFQYNMFLENATWYIHHLAGTRPAFTSGGLLSPSELDTFQEDDSFDYADEEEFDALRNLFPDD